MLVAQAPGTWAPGGAYSPFLDKNYLLNACPTLYWSQLQGQGPLAETIRFFLDKNIIKYFKFILALRSLRQLRGQGPLAGPVRLFLDKNFITYLPYADCVSSGDTGPWRGLYALFR